MGECRRRMMTEVHHPYDAEVEYIESTGTQYINTGITPTATLVTEVRFALTDDYPFENTSAIFGIFDNRGSYYSVSFPSLNYARIPSGAGNYVNIPITMGLGTVHNISYKSEAFYFDGELKGTQKPNIKENALNIRLFGRAASPNSSSRIIAGIRIYGFKMIDSGNIVHDCIPVRIGTAGYLFDKVSGVLFGNNGTGSFEVGPDTVVYKSAYDSEIEYLQSTGEQYIDTGIIPDNDTGIQIVYYPSKYNHLNADDFFIVGSRNNTSNTRWCIGKSGQEAVAFYYGYGIYNHAPNQNQYNRKYIVALNYKNNKLLEVKDVAANNQTQQRTLSDLSFTPLYNIRLFGAAGVDANYTKASGRLYSVIISQGNKIIMNLIPVRVGDVGYMYDKISKQLFGNNGTGSFVLGADKH